MKKLLITNVLLFICACTYVQAQINLVRNPGFEIHSGCPVFNDQAYLATGWNGIDSNWTFGGSYPTQLCLPEYINNCATHSSGQSFPDGAYWYQYPRSGNGMVGCRFYSDGGGGGHYCI